MALRLGNAKFCHLSVRCTYLCRVVFARLNGDMLPVAGVARQPGTAREPSLWTRTARVEPPLSGGVFVASLHVFEVSLIIRLSEFAGVAETLVQKPGTLVERVAAAVNARRAVQSCW